MESMHLFIKGLITILNQTCKKSIERIIEALNKNVNASIDILDNYDLWMLKLYELDLNQ